MDLVLHTSHDEGVTHCGLQERGTNMVLQLASQKSWTRLRRLRRCKRSHSPVALTPPVHESHVRHPRSARRSRPYHGQSRALDFLYSSSSSPSRSFTAKSFSTSGVSVHPCMHSIEFVWLFVDMTSAQTTPSRCAY